MPWILWFLTGSIIYFIFEISGLKWSFFLFIWVLDWISRFFSDHCSNAHWSKFINIIFKLFMLFIFAHHYLTFLPSVIEQLIYRLSITVEFLICISKQLCIFLIRNNCLFGSNCFCWEYLAFFFIRVHFFIFIIWSCPCCSHNYHILFSRLSRLFV